MSSNSSNLNTLLNAKSVAIVGVSTNKGKIGSVLLQNLRASGFTGDIYPVNPKYDKIDDLKCYLELSSIPGEIDVVCISIPSPYVKGVVEDVIKKGAKSVVIISAGFGEVDPEGAKLEKEISEMLSSKGIALLGPNCLGYMNTTANINLTFAATYPAKGDIAIFSQSGAICTALLDMAMAEDVGFSHLISVGNKAGIHENSLTEHFLNDENVKVIGAYLENFVYGREFCNIYKSSDYRKPVVVIKPGATKQAASAIMSHTGAIASSQKAMEVALKQHGVVYTETITDFYQTVKSFSWLKEIKGKNAVIVTNAGGPGILATDETVLSGLNLYSIPIHLKESLQRILPVEASVKNPIDVLGDARADRYSAVFKTLDEDEDIDVVFVLVSPQFVTNIPNITKAIISYSKSTCKTVIPIYLGNEVVQEGLDMCEDEKVLAFRDSRNAIKQIDTVSDYYVFRDKKKGKNTQWSYDKGISSSNLLHGQSGVLATEASEKLMQAYRIPMLKQHLALNMGDALQWATTNYPVVLKVPNDVLAHKTEKKGVVLNINSDSDLKNAWKTLSELSDYLLLQEQIKFEEELFVGANKDGGRNSGFGHLTVFGLGGIYAEVFKDFGYVLSPASRSDILESLSETKVGRILTGLRGKSPLAVGKFVELIERVQMMLADNPEITSLDLNPVLITNNSVHAVDVKVYI